MCIRDSNAVEGLVGAFVELSALCIGDVLHNVKSLSTALGAGVAADTAVNFGIKLHHNCLGGGNLFDVVNLLDEGEEGQGCHIHIVLNLGRAGETYLKLAVALYAIDGGAGAAEAVSAAAADVYKRQDKARSKAAPKGIAKSNPVYYILKCPLCQTKKTKPPEKFSSKDDFALHIELYYSKSDLSTGKLFILFNFLNSLRIKAKVRIPVNASVIALSLIHI